MEQRFLESLDHPIPKKANNYMLSSYSIILEAWRRGLDVTIRIVKEKSGKIEPYYTISNGKKTHKFSTTRGDLVSVEAKQQTKNKVTTKEYLHKNNVPTPIGKEFPSKATNEEILQYAKELGYPLVIKPVSGTGGKGVIAGIQNQEELIEALEYVRVKLKSPQIILEKYFEGEDYRLYVLDGEVVGALKRIKANIIGNGKDSIRKLIEDKNKIRSQLPSLTNRPIKIDEETKSLLRRKDYDFNTILPEGELLYIKTKNNVSAGGDSIDVTDQVSNNIKNIAIAATNSFDSLPHYGIDIMVDEKKDKGVIIEINSRAHITQHLFPMKGLARDIPSSIIDFYFPETKDYDREEAFKMYLDFDYIYNSCIGREADEIKIPKIPNKILLKRYILSNCDYQESLANRVRRIAYNHQVNGYIKPLQNGDISIVVGGNSSKVDGFYKSLTKYASKMNEGYTIKEKNRTTPIQHGFHILQNENIEEKSSTDIYMKKYSKLQSDYQSLVKRLAEFEQNEKIMELTKKQNKQLKKRLKLMENSSSWKVTKPIRKITSFVKK